MHVQRNVDCILKHKHKNTDQELKAYQWPCHYGFTKTEDKRHKWQDPAAQNMNCCH